MASALQFKKDLKSYLLDGTLTGNFVQGRYYAGVAPQKGDLPYLVVDTINANGNYSHEGPTGNDEYRIQFTIVSNMTSELETIRDSIVDRLEALRNTNINLTRFGYAFLDNEVDDYAFNNGLSTAFKSKLIDFKLMVRPSPVVPSTGDTWDTADTWETANTWETP